MSSPQDLLREYAALSRRRTGEGVTPLEYQRWLDLGLQLDRLFPHRPRRTCRGRTVMRIEFPSRDALRENAMLEVKPIGIFVNTPFAPEIGTDLDLRVTLEATGDRLESRVTVVSANLGPGFSTATLGMGLRFHDASCPLRSLLEALCERPGEAHARVPGSSPAA